MGDQWYIYCNTIPGTIDTHSKLQCCYKFRVIQHVAVIQYCYSLFTISTLIAGYRFTGGQ